MSQMLPEKTNNSPTDDNLLDPSADEHSPRPNAFDNPTTEQTEQETASCVEDIAKTPSEVRQLTIADTVEPSRDICDDNPISSLCRQYEIRPAMVSCLRKFGASKMRVVIDDSGSMTTPIKGEQHTRWAKSCEIVKKLLELDLVFHPDGMQIRFINSKRIFEVKTSSEVDQIYGTVPRDYTPLVPKLNEIIQEHRSSEDSDKKLLLFVITDGQPTDKCGNSDIHALEKLMKERPKDTIYVTFIVCTDDPASVAYLNGWDEKMANVSIIDDFHIERDKLYQRLDPCRRSFSIGDYLVKMLVGAIYPDFDSFFKNNE